MKTEEVHTIPSSGGSAHAVLQNVFTGLNACFEVDVNLVECLWVCVYMCLCVCLCVCCVFICV